MALRQELWSCGRLPAVRFLYWKPSRYKSTSAARLVSRGSSSNTGNKVFPAVSWVKLVSPESHLSETSLSRGFTRCTNAGAPFWQRREVMQLCFLSGLFLSELLQQSGAVALENNVGLSAGAVALENNVGLSAGAEVGLVNGRLRSCEGNSPCVSTSAFRSPSRFMPPWQYLGAQAAAYGELLKALKRMGAVIVEAEDARYVYATLSTSSSREDIDDVEFLFVDKVVCFRSFSRKTALDPPFCWWPGCITGPRNRGRMEALRDDLGWIPLETDEDKAWTPIFLH